MDEAESKVAWRTWTPREESLVHCEEVVDVADVVQIIWEGGRRLWVRRAWRVECPSLPVAPIMPSMMEDV